MKKQTIITILLLFFSFIFIASCTDDEVSTNPNDKLSFNESSYTFDTVFTTIGSTTATIKVFNKNNKALNISSIYLAEGSSSPFKLNVSGQSNVNHSFSDIFMRAKDSMYLFIQVTIDPTLQNSPVLIRDSIIFIVNGNTQYYLLEAYGQDVVILRNTALLNDTTLLNTKPYLIYDNLSIAPNKTLTIEKGSVFYLHNNARITIHGNLNAIGTHTEPIIFRGDRMDEILEDDSYDAYSGQWRGLIFTSETGIHQLEYVNIRNAKTGIHIWCGDATQPQLSIKNSIIHNFDSCGILAKNVKLDIVNSQISNCGYYCLKLQGGEFNIIHSTIANFYSKSDRTSASVLIKNHENGGIVLYPITQGDIKNCIIHGNRDEELVLDYKVSGVPVATSFNVTIANTLINGASSSDTHFSNILWSNSSQSIFVYTEEYPFNFQLSLTSLAKNTADMVTAALYPTDIIDNNRLADGQADMGAYEWVSP